MISKIRLKPYAKLIPPLKPYYANPLNKDTSPYGVNVSEYLHSLMDL